jgi:hypothetical protein
MLCFHKGIAKDSVLLGNVLGMSALADEGTMLSPSQLEPRFFSLGEGLTLRLYIIYV